MTFTKVLDLGDHNGSSAPLMLETSTGTRGCAPLSREQLFYLKARLDSICDKLSASEKPFE